MHYKPILHLSDNINMKYVFVALRDLIILSIGRY